MTLLTRRWSPMRRLRSIEPVGILKACTTKVRMKRARITATTTDSRYSRATDFLKAGVSARGGLWGWATAIAAILAECGRIGSAGAADQEADICRGGVSGRGRTLGQSRARARP